MKGPELQKYLKAKHLKEQLDEKQPQAGDFEPAAFEGVNNPYYCDSRFSGERLELIED